MSRSRNIKPGFFKNEDLAECSPWARLCFAGLWTIADREGRLEDRPKRIKGDLFAFDSIEVDPLLDELQHHKFILRYEIDDCRYIQILEFAKHQNPHHKEAKSVIPSPQSPRLSPHAMEQKSEALPPMHELKNLDKPETSPRLSPQDMQFHDPGTVLIPSSLIPDSQEREEREKPNATGKPKRQPRTDHTFADWIASLASAGEMAIPETDPVFANAERAGLPDEFVALEWAWFKRKYGTAAKRYRDWRQVFRNAVDGAWGSLWRPSDTGGYVLTTAGLQLQRSLADPE